MVPEGTMLAAPDVVSLFVQMKKSVILKSVYLRTKLCFALCPRPDKGTPSSLNAYCAFDLIICRLVGWGVKLCHWLGSWVLRYAGQHDWFYTNFFQSAAEA